MFESILKLDPSNGQAHNNMGMAYHYKGDSAKAEKYLQDAKNLGYQ